MTVLILMKYRSLAERMLANCKHPCWRSISVLLCVISKLSWNNRVSSKCWSYLVHDNISLLIKSGQTFVRHISNNWRRLNLSFKCALDLLLILNIYKSTKCLNIKTVELFSKSGLQRRYILMSFRYFMVMPFFLSLESTAWNQKNPIHRGF